ncbi:MAG: HK97 family phage prohead protease [Phocaeicola sp.]
MSKKRVILSDSSLNRYGYRVLTEGMNIDFFLKNPVMLYMHLRDEGSKFWGDSKAIGHWEDIKIEGDVLSAVPVFDMVDELSQTIAKKFEAGTFNAASVGIRILGTSSDKDKLVPGQRRETVTECELMEASIVDVPANANAVRLYETGSDSVHLATGLNNNVVPDLKKNSMNLKATWKSVLAFLKIEEDKAESTELSADNIESLNTEMGRLTTENQTLVNAKKKVDEALATSATEVATLKSSIETKDAEIATLKTSEAGKVTEIAQLKEQIENLKKNPTSTLNLNPKGEQSMKEGDRIASLCSDFKGSTMEMIDKLKEEGAI